MTRRLDIIDEIDVLVDEQLSRYDERSGYDYNVGTEECWHCGGDWHGLPVTERVRDMRSFYCGCEECVAHLARYRADEDDSPIWCPGSEFIGPWANRRQLRRIREGLVGTEWGWLTPDEHRRLVRPLEAAQEWAESVSDRPYVWPSYDISGPVSVQFNGTGEWVEIGTLAPDSDPPPRAEEVAYRPDYTLRWSMSPMGVLERRLRPMQELLRRALEDAGFSWTIPPNPLDPEPEPASPTPQERALPRPSNEPPMWAIQPNRQRRRRNRR